ncbi:unnamed protein product [Sphagnum balticum]
MHRPIRDRMRKAGSQQEEEDGEDRMYRFLHESLIVRRQWDSWLAVSLTGVDGRELGEGFDHLTHDLLFSDYNSLDSLLHTNTFVPPVTKQEP